MIIREIKPADYPVLEDFLYHAYDNTPSGENALNSRDEIFEPDIYEQIKDFGVESDCGVVAEQDGLIVGAAWTRMLPNDEFPAYNDITDLTISVLPKYRGKNIGTKIMKKLFELLIERGYEKTLLHVNAKNPAFRLYKRLGYEITDSYMDHIDNDVYEEVYIMVKDLIAKTDCINVT